MKCGVWIVDLEPYWLVRGPNGVTLDKAINAMKKHMKKWPNDECIIYEIVNGSSTSPIELNICTTAP